MKNKTILGLLIPLGIFLIYFLLHFIVRSHYQNVKKIMEENPVRYTIASIDNLYVANAVFFDPCFEEIFIYSQDVAEKGRGGVYLPRGCDHMVMLGDHKLYVIDSVENYPIHKVGFRHDGQWKTAYIHKDFLAKSPLVY